jgi:hypothetical protein
MNKFFEIKGRIAITGDPMADAKLLAGYQVEYEAFHAKFCEAGGALGMRIVTEKVKGEAVVAAPEPEKNQVSDLHGRHRPAAE